MPESWHIFIALHPPIFSFMSFISVYTMKTLLEACTYTVWCSRNRRRGHFSLYQRVQIKGVLSWEGALHVYGLVHPQMYYGVSMRKLWSALSSLSTQEFSERVKFTYQGHLKRIQSWWLICSYVRFRSAWRYRSAWLWYRSVCQW